MMLCFLEKHEELFHYSNEKRHDDDDRKLFYLSIVFWGTAIEANMRKYRSVFQGLITIISSSLIHASISFCYSDHIGINLF